MMKALGFLWGIVVGLVFSTVGAAGGILAGFGSLHTFRSSKGFLRCFSQRKGESKGNKPKAQGEPRAEEGKNSPKE